MPPKWTHTAEIFTGSSHVKVNCRIVEEIPPMGQFVMIEFPHPTVRRMIASRVIKKDSLVPK